MANAVFTILVDCRSGVWAFDDPARGLQREALIAGIPEMIVAIAKRRGIRKPEQGVNIVFSANPFPGHDVCLERTTTPDADDRMMGNTYRIQGTDMEGWLCPALFKYFDAAPERIYVMLQPVH